MLKDHLQPPKGTYTPWPVEQHQQGFNTPTPPPLQDITPPMGPDPVLRSSLTPLNSVSPDSLNNFYRSGIQHRRVIALP